MDVFQNPPSPYSSKILGRGRTLISPNEPYFTSHSKEDFRFDDEAVILLLVKGICKGHLLIRVTPSVTPTCALTGWS